MIFHKINLFQLTLSIILFFMSAWLMGPFKLIPLSFQQQLTVIFKTVLFSGIEIVHTQYFFCPEIWDQVS